VTMRDAIVAPADLRSIARRRSRLVWRPVAGLEDARADRVGDLGLLDFRPVERVAAFGLDLLAMESPLGSSATPSAAPPQPCPGKITRRGRTLKEAQSRPAAQQRSDPP
jgi:hypothetical protein